MRCSSLLLVHVVTTPIFGLHVICQLYSLLPLRLLPSPSPPPPPLPPHTTSCHPHLIFRHGTRNRAKHFCGHVDSFAPRELPSAAEKAVRALDKVVRPSQAAAAKVPGLAKLPIEVPPPSVEVMRTQVKGSARLVDAMETDALVTQVYAAWCAVEHTLAALCALPPSFAAEPVRLADLPLHAYSQQLLGVYKIRVRQSVMTPAELSVWAAYDAFSLAHLNADAERAARTARNKQLKQVQSHRGLG